MPHTVELYSHVQHEMTAEARFERMNSLVLFEKF